MFCHTVSDEIQLKLLELHDAEEIFSLIDASRSYLREWLPWVDATRTPDDSKAFNPRFSNLPPTTAFKRVSCTKKSLPVWLGSMT